MISVGAGSSATPEAWSRTGPSPSLFLVRRKLCDHLEARKVERDGGRVRKLSGTERGTKRYESVDTSVECAGRGGGWAVKLENDGIWRDEVLKMMRRQVKVKAAGLLV